MQAQSIESGVQLFSRLNQRTCTLNNINPKLFPHGGPHPNEIIEITGDFCKDLMVDFLVRCILPKELNSEWKDTGVVFVNTDHHINILKITTLIDAHLKHLNIQSRKPIIEKALRQITILNCYSGEQLEITLKNLEKTVQNRSNVSLLIVDNITSQYWIEKQTNEKLSLENYSKTFFQILQSIIKNLNLVLIFSRYQTGDLKKTVDYHVDYKIVVEKLGLEQQCIVIDYEKKTSTNVLFEPHKFIMFL